MAVRPADFFFDWQEQKRVSCVFTLDNRGEVRIFPPFFPRKARSNMSVTSTYPTRHDTNARLWCAGFGRLTPAGSGMTPRDNLLSRTVQRVT